MSNMLNAFLSQQKFTDKEADEYEQSIQKMQKENMDKAISSFSKTQNIADNMNIPTQNPKIEEETVSHDNFKNYDHSLEITRNGLAGIDAMGGADGIEFGDLESGDVL